MEEYGGKQDVDVEHQHGTNMNAMIWKESRMEWVHGLGMWEMFEMN